MVNYLWNIHYYAVYYRVYRTMAYYKVYKTMTLLSASTYV